MLNYIPQTRLSPAQEIRYSKIIRKGNRILAHHAERIYKKKRKCRFFRKQLFGGKLEIKQKELPNGQVIIDNVPPLKPAVYISQQDLDAINAVRKLEWEMMCACAGTMRTIASRWHGLTKEVTGWQEDDYGHIAVIAFIDGLYGYGISKRAQTDEGKYVKFNGFVYTVINNRMIEQVAKSSLLGGVRVKDFILAGRLANARLSNPESTYDELVEILKISPDALRSLEDSRRQVISESQMRLTSSGSGEHSEFNDDYTALSIVGGESVTLDPDMKAAIENAGLSSAEQDVLITSLKPYHGWQSDVARRHVNPQTNQPYTRAWTNAVLPKIHRKVRAAYGDVGS